MDSRERVNRAVRFEEPDRVPFMHAVLPAGWFMHGPKLHAILRRYPSDLVATAEEVVDERAGGGATFGYQTSGDLARLYPVEDDFAYLGARSFQLGAFGTSGLSRDEWGCVWEKLDPGVVGQVVEHPLADWSEFDRYRWPDPHDHWRFDWPNLRAQVAKARARGKYVVAYTGNLFELMQWLRGYVQLLEDVVADPGKVTALAERVTEYNVGTTEQWLQLDGDAVGFNDDWGTQLALMIRPELWRSLFKPHYRRLFDQVHAAGRHVHFHTDGNTLDILPDLLELGVDVVNLQLSAMDAERAAAIIGGKMCLRTDVDRQYILTRASPSEVTDYVRRLLDLFGGPRGGLIACGEVNSDSRLENVAAMYEAFERYGRY
jgi:uroporphyrinogen decarboxylase